MANTINHSSDSVALKAMRVIAFFLVIIGMLNTLPSIPGLDELIWETSGNNRIVIRKYNYEYFFPLTFFIMMIVVVLKHSFWREFKDRGKATQIFSFSKDVCLILMAALISTSYLIEIDLLYLNLDQGWTFQGIKWRCENQNASMPCTIFSLVKNPSVLKF